MRSVKVYKSDPETQTQTQTLEQVNKKGTKHIGKQEHKKAAPAMTGASTAPHMRRRSDPGDAPAVPRLRQQEATRAAEPSTPVADAYQTAACWWREAAGCCWIRRRRVSLRAPAAAGDGAVHLSLDSDARRW